MYAVQKLINLYSKYAFVGVIVTIISIGVREVVGSLLPSDTPFYFTISIGLAYLCGFVLSYSGHKTFTFSDIDQLAFGLGRSIAIFLFIALLGMLSTMLISLAVRYLLPLDDYLGKGTASFAFAFGVLLSSIGTFALNRFYTFRGDTHKAHALQKNTSTSRTNITRDIR